LKIRNIEFDKFGAVILLPKNHEGLKTGSRRIRLIDATPYILGWINNHPKKADPDAPLFPFKTTRVQFLTRKYARLAGVTKHSNPHAFRHARLTHLSQIYNEMELREFAGWGRESNMPSVYIHISGKDLDRKLLEHHGLLEEEKKLQEETRPLKPLKCPRCEVINPADAGYCYKCSMALTLNAATEAVIKREYTDNLMNKLLEYPEVQELLKLKLADLEKQHPT